MAMGPGRYDDLCTEARLKADAAGALLIVFGGSKGDGFAAQLPAELTLMLPGILRIVADQIEESIVGRKH